MCVVLLRHAFPSSSADHFVVAISALSLSSKRYAFKESFARFGADPLLRPSRCFGGIVTHRNHSWTATNRRKKLDSFRSNRRRPTRFQFGSRRIRFNVTVKKSSVRRSTFLHFLTTNLKPDIDRHGRRDCRTTTGRRKRIPCRCASNRSSESRRAYLNVIGNVETEMSYA